MVEASTSFLQRGSYLNDFHILRTSCARLTSSLALSPFLPLLPFSTTSDQTSTPAERRRSEDTPLGCRGRHTPRVRRSPWQVHQKCPEGKQSSDKHWR